MKHTKWCLATSWEYKRNDGNKTRDKRKIQVAINLMRRVTQVLYVRSVFSVLMWCDVVRKRWKFTEHSDDGFSWLSLPRFSVNGPLDAVPETVALYSEAHPHVKYRYGQHRHEEKYETTELIKREVRHIRQQHGTHRRLLGMTTGSCKQMRETCLSSSKFLSSHFHILSL